MAYGVKETGSGALNEIHTQSTGHTNAPILLVAGSTSTVFVKGTTTQPYSSSITPDIATGLQKGITVTDGSAFTVNAPMQLFPGAAITFHFFNNSGGPIGGITWASLYQLTGNNGTFVGPPDGSRSTISFYYDGANLIETDRTSAIIGASPYPYTRELTTSGLTTLIENLPRRQIKFTTKYPAGRWENTGTLQVYSMDLEATVTLSKIAFLAGTTALANGINQWACILDSGMNVLAVLNRQDIDRLGRTGTAAIHHCHQRRRWVDHSGHPRARPVLFRTPGRGLYLADTIGSGNDLRGRRDVSDVGWHIDHGTHESCVAHHARVQHHCDGERCVCRRWLIPMPPKASLSPPDERRSE